MTPPHGDVRPSRIGAGLERNESDVRAHVDEMSACPVVSDSDLSGSSVSFFFFDCVGSVSLEFHRCGYMTLAEKCYCN